MVLRFLGSVSFLSSVHMLWPYFIGLALGIACLVVLLHQYVILVLILLDYCSLCINIFHVYWYLYLLVNWMYRLR